MITPARLVSGSVLTGSVTSYYLCPAVTVAVIKRADFCNTTGLPVSVTAYVVKSGSTAGTANTILSAFSVAAGTTYVSPELSGAVLGPGDSLQVLGSGVTLIVSGILQT